jgi:hypothetical protein
MSNKKTLAILAALIISAITLAIATTGVLSSISVNQTIPSLGRITVVQSSPNIGIYNNNACTQNASSIDWGTIQPGNSASRTIYIKNHGTNNATLNLSAIDWNPANANGAITLAWNIDGKTLAPNEVVQATLTLTISTTIDTSITTFSFNIQITGTG